MKSSALQFVAGLLVLGMAAGSTLAGMGIEDNLYSVSVEAGAGSFTVVHKPSGKTILTGGKLSEAGGTAKAVKLADPMLGDGQGVEITYADGNRETVALYRGLPFVTFRSTLHNGGGEPVVLNHIPTVSAAIDLGKPLAEIRTLGTGGLLEPGKNPGSYAFLTVVDPATRSGVVGGWLTHDRGSGVVFSPVEGQAVRMQARLDYGRLRIKPGQDAAAEMFAIGYFDDARLGLEAYADAVAKVYAIKLPPHRPGYCTWYMEKHAGSCNEKYLPELSEYAAKNLKPFGFDFIQIDDGWQQGIAGNGPRKNFTAYQPTGAYPTGMKATADNIKKLGMTPGIWFMPFAGTAKDPYFKDHQDWFVKDTKGQPYETAWGGTCLDMTQVGAREHLRSIVERIAHTWGYTLFKMDGFWTGSATKQIYVNDGFKEDGIGDAEFANPDKTNVEALRDGVRLVRQTAGPDVFLLGCCVSQNMRSFGGSFGLLDAMRVGPDTGAGHIGAPHASRLWFLNGRIWWNDPDCVSVRTSTTLEQARLNATFTAIADAVFYNSDWMPDFPAERLDILRRCMPSHGLPSRPVDVFESQPARIWHLTHTQGGVRRDVVALYNWGKEAAVVSCPATRVGLPAAAEYVGFDFWNNKFVPPFKETVRADLTGGSCRVLAIRPVTNHPQLISTSRHLTQGIVDVTGETWDAAGATLSGTSQVVAGDPYELRIVVPLGDASWRAAAATVSTGAKAEFKQDGPRLRVTITSADSRAVAWQVKFDSAKIADTPPAPVTQLLANADVRGVKLTWADSGADLYRVERGDGVVSLTPVCLFADAAVERGKSCRYSVTALGWNGSSSQPVSAEAVMPEAIRPPPTPPAPTVQLSTLKAVSVTNGWGAAAINKSISGGVLKIEGKGYKKGIGAHAPALSVYAIPAGAKRFVSFVGLDDATKDDPRASVVFEVYGDVKEMGEKPVLLAQSPVLSSKTIRFWAFDVALDSRVKELRLVVTDAGDGNAGDHADWANAGFILPKDK